MSTIILADDDAIFRETTAMQLRKLGFTVVEDETCDPVMRQVEQLKPVACIIDMVMPGKEGMETMFELARLPDRPQLIAVSGNPHYLATLKDFIVDAVLAKPIKPEALKNTLAELGCLP